MGPEKRGWGLSRILKGGRHLFGGWRAFWEQKERMARGPSWRELSQINVLHGKGTCVAGVRDPEESMAGCRLE